MIEAHSRTAKWRRPSHASCTRRRSVAASSQSLRRSLELETLESRSLLASITLSGFPAGGFRTDWLDGTAPWNVAIVVDNASQVATGFAESTERPADAPLVSVVPGQTSWVAGIIGDNLLRLEGGRTNELDIYRLEFPAGDHYALNIQVLASRLDSKLDPALALYNAAGVLMVSNDDALHEGFLSDAELWVGVDAGVYYLVVSAGGNAPNSDGLILDVAQFGQTSRGSTGPYLLQINAVPDSTRPTVMEMNLEPGVTLEELPTEIVVRFSEAMTLEGIRRGATLTHSQGQSIALRATEYDSESAEVTYQLLDRPSPGSYQFTIHSSLATDRAGNRLDGGSSNGDFVVSFEIAEFPDPLVDQEPNASVSEAQELGSFYVNELRNGVRVTGNTVAAPGEVDHDFYCFEVTRAGFFTIRLGPAGEATDSGVLRLFDYSGNLMAQGFRFPGMGSSMLRWLTPGEYIVEVDGGPAAPGTYQLTLQSAQAEGGLVVDSDPSPSIQVTLRSFDGQRPPEVRQPEPADVEATQVLDGMSRAVTSLPVVASQPVGQPRAARAGASELAWFDPSGGGGILPIGFRFEDATTRGSSQFSVDGVSGSFLDPLPDALSHGVHALRPSKDLVLELTAIFQRDLDGASAAGDAEESAQERLDRMDPASVDQDDASGELFDFASTPTSMALGMVASLGAASAMTVPNHRRSHPWLQRAFEWLATR